MKQRSVLVQNVSTDALTSDTTIIYTVPPNTRSKWVLAFLSNGTGSTVSGVALEIHNGGDIVVLGAKSLGAGDFVMFDSASGYVMLEEGYELRARADATGVSCIVTVEETTGLVRTN